MHRMSLNLLRISCHNLHSVVVSLRSHHPLQISPHPRSIEFHIACQIRSHVTVAKGHIRSTFTFSSRVFGLLFLKVWRLPSRLHHPTGLKHFIFLCLRSWLMSMMGSDHPFYHKHGPDLSLSLFDFLAFLVVYFQTLVNSSPKQSEKV